MLSLKSAFLLFEASESSSTARRVLWVTLTATLSVPAFVAVLLLQVSASPYCLAYGTVFRSRSFGVTSAALYDALAVRPYVLRQPVRGYVCGTVLCTRSSPLLCLDSLTHGVAAAFSTCSSSSFLTRLVTELPFIAAFSTCSSSSSCDDARTSSVEEFPRAFVR